MSLIGSRVDSCGRHQRGPVFFCGYGHLGQVRQDMPRWPGYGVNLIQIELEGPAGTLVGENEVSLKEAEAVAKVLAQAQPSLRDLAPRPTQPNTEALGYSRLSVRDRRLVSATRICERH